MQQIMSRLRKAIDEYNMIETRDRVAVALSGGKDSALMLKAMARLSEFHPKNFTVCAVFVDLGLGNIDIEGIKRLCEDAGTELNIKYTEIGKIIFDYRREQNPCALCAKMRRGVIHDGAIELGARKIALGHHMDDAVETFMMNLMYEGRIGCFQPVTYLSRSGLTQIRPMLYVGEQAVTRFAAREQLPVVHNTCPADKHTKRQEVKELLASLQAQYPDVKTKIFGAMQRLPLPQWGVEKT